MSASEPEPRPQPLAQKVALVTGGSRGIGWAIARRFAQEGATVVIASRSAPPSPQLPSPQPSPRGRGSDTSPPVGGIEGG
ncbi:MAG: SDR family NAD(P)-dependent oxidoreductase, partial [Anaerolineae bacterium]|nr:SDR family NAD(P)-dependent oxidoreductase [Anaerolineae bacterium]